MEIACPTCATTYEIDDASVGDAGRKVRCAACGTIWRTFRDRPSELIDAPAPQAAAAPPPETVLVETAPPMAPSEEDVAREAGEKPPEEIAWSDESPNRPQDEAARAEALPTEPAAVQEPTARKAKIVGGGKPKKAVASGMLKRFVSWPAIVAVGAIAVLSLAIFQRERVVRMLPQTAVVFAAAGMPVNLRGIEIRDVKSRMVDENGVSVLVIEGGLTSVARERVAVPRLRFAVLGDKGQELYVWSAQADRPVLQPGESMTFRRRLAAPPNDGRDVSVRFLSASDITAGLK